MQKLKKIFSAVPRFTISDMLIAKTFIFLFPDPLPAGSFNACSLIVPYGCANYTAA